MENAVPLWLAARPLRTQMLQPFFLIISDVTHSPRSVAVSPLVVTNGSKIVGSTLAGIPVPLSAMVSLT